MTDVDPEFIETEIPLLSCRTCGALVAGEFRDAHAAWHSGRQTPRGRRGQWSDPGTPPGGKPERGR